MAHAISISETDRSKLSDENWSTRLPGVSPEDATSAADSCTKPRCSMRTPLGRPVEPEVNNT